MENSEENVHVDIGAILFALLTNTIIFQKECTKRVEKDVNLLPQKISPRCDGGHTE